MLFECPEIRTLFSSEVVGIVSRFFLPSTPKPSSSRRVTFYLFHVINLDLNHPHGAPVLLVLFRISNFDNVWKIDSRPQPSFTQASYRQGKLYSAKSTVQRYHYKQCHPFAHDPVSLDGIDDSRPSPWISSSSSRLRTQMSLHHHHHIDITRDQLLFHHQV